MDNIIRSLAAAMLLLIPFCRASVDLHELCRSRPVNQYYVHPDDCSKFFTCVNGYAFTQPCPYGTAFDESQRSCQLKDAVPCHSGHYNEINSIQPPRRSERVEPRPPPPPRRQPPRADPPRPPQPRPDRRRPPTALPREDRRHASREILDRGPPPLIQEETVHFVHRAIPRPQPRPQTRPPPRPQTRPQQTRTGPRPQARPHQTRPGPRPQARPHQTQTGSRPQPASPRRDRNEVRQGTTTVRGPDFDVIAAVREFLEEGHGEARDKASNMMRREANVARTMTYSRGSFGGVQAFLGSSPYARQMGIPAFEQLEFLRIVRKKFDLNRNQVREVIKRINSIIQPSKTMVGPDMPMPRPEVDNCPYPMNEEKNECNPRSKYRTHDGTCNNLKRPLWGRSMRPLDRFLEPDYYDGIGSLRRAKSGRHLLSARAISAAVFKDEDRSSKVHTSLLMTFGQLLDHDMSRTAVTKLTKVESGNGDMVDTKCGETGCETKGWENRACVPIWVPRNDPDFHNKSCLMFVRTQEVMRDSCIMAPREQLNQLTSYLDASMVYASGKDDSLKIRDLSDTRRGKLKLKSNPVKPSAKGLLPTAEVKDCRETNATVRCFAAGDGRVNEQVGLISLHTLMQRAHNTLEEQLYRINPHWEGETLYQETRRLLTAAWQFIVYNEYVPIILGTREIHRHGISLLRDGYFRGYDDSVNPEQKNAFATAAYRFGHSQIDTRVAFGSHSWNNYREQDLSTQMRRPGSVYRSQYPGETAVDAIILGQIIQPAQQVDQFFSKQISAKLFSENPPHGLGTDLVSINIQRGRDHGLPGYNEWRKFCGLSVARSFEDMTDIPYETRQKFKALYEDVDDVDLYPAGITERQVSGGMVGPTFACIIGRQFRSLRVGDRFWHERYDPVVGFSPDQLREIRRFSFARLICDNLDRASTIQRFVFLQPLSEAFKNLGSENYGEAYSLASLYQGERNERRSCSHIPLPDLSAWSENRHG